MRNHAPLPLSPSRLLSSVLILTTTHAAWLSSGHCACYFTAWQRCGHHFQQSLIISSFDPYSFRTARDSGNDLCSSSENFKGSCPQLQNEIPPFVSCSPFCARLSSFQMAPKSYTWITIWFLITAPLMLWDAGYCLMRPRSMVGGDLHWIWKPYEAYEKVDYVYGVKAFENGEGFAGAAAILNIIENFTNIVYLYKVHISHCDLAPIFGYTGAVMTLAKTILYITQEYFCSGCAVGHNDLLVAVGFWIMPNIVWIIFCSLIIRRLGKDIASYITKGSEKTMKIQ